MTESAERDTGVQQVSESQIAVHWREEEYYYPPESFVAQANANDPAIFDRFSCSSAGWAALPPVAPIAWQTPARA